MPKLETKERVSVTREYARTHQGHLHPALWEAIEACREYGESGQWAMAVAEAFDCGWVAGATQGGTKPSD